MLLERHISNIEELKFPTINELIIPFYEPYEHVLCHPPPRLRLYTPTQLALAPGSPFLFLGERTVGVAKRRKIKKMFTTSFCIF